MTHQPHTALTPESKATDVAADYEWMIGSDRAPRATKDGTTYAAWDGPMPGDLIDQFENDSRITVVQGDGTMHDRLDKAGFSLVEPKDGELT